MIIIAILGTGIRRGEVINHQWSDVDFVNKSISVFGKSRRKETFPLRISWQKNWRDIIPSVNKIGEL